MKGLLRTYHTHGAGINCNNSSIDEWLSSASKKGELMIEDPDSAGEALWVPRGFTPPRSAKGLFEGGDGTGGPFNTTELEDIWKWCHVALDRAEAHQTPRTRSERKAYGPDLIPGGELVHLTTRGYESQTKGGKRLRRRRRTQSRKRSRMSVRRRRTQSRKRSRMSVRRRRQPRKSRRITKHRRTQR